MNESPTLLTLLEEWRQWTLTETQAIRAQDWSRVRACQQTKKQLHTLLQVPLDSRDFGAQGPLRRLVDELLDLEAANSQWLAGQTAALHARLQALEGSSRNLKRVRSSYLLPERPHWQSYS